MSHKVEVEFDEMFAGLRCVGVLLTKEFVFNFGEQTHRCGYVAVSKTSLLYEKDYNDYKFPYELFKQTLDRPIGDLSPILVFLSILKDFKKEVIALEYICDVHGGLTYSSYSETYPVAAEDVWWFGFDCAHCDDILAKCTKLYVRDNCFKLAKQLVEIETLLQASSIINKDVKI